MYVHYLLHMSAFWLCTRVVVCHVCFVHFISHLTCLSCMCVDVCISSIKGVFFSRTCACLIGVERHPGVTFPHAGSCRTRRSKYDTGFLFPLRVSLFVSACSLGCLCVSPTPTTTGYTVHRCNLECEGCSCALSSVEH